MGKSAINGPFSMATLNYHIVPGIYHIAASCALTKFSPSISSASAPTRCGCHGNLRWFHDVKLRWFNDVKLTIKIH
jgi:hypothetical protein